MLVVDSAVAVRSRLVARLREAGLDIVGEVASVDLAIALAGSQHPRVVIVDVDLPGHRGLAVIADLRVALPNAALVVFTNASPYRRACLAAGAVRFLDKSSEFDSVAQAVVELLAA